LLDAGVVDTVEIGLVPIMLGHGIPMLPKVARRTRLTLTKSQEFASGIVLLKYDVRYGRS
jgi:dihydrofolate reductase